MTLFTGYQGWVDGVRDWLDVDDFTDAQIATFLYLAHVRLNKALESEHMQQTFGFVSAGAPAPIDIGTIVPNFNKMRLVSVVGGPSLDALVINEMVDKISANISGDPVWYAVDSGNLIIYPYPADGSNINVLYYGMVPQLTSVAPSNVFTQWHEDALLYACCVEATPYMAEDERASTWATMLMEIIEAVNATAKKATHGSAPLKRKIAMFA